MTAPGPAPLLDEVPYPGLVPVQPPGPARGPVPAQATGPLGDGERRAALRRLRALGDELVPTALERILAEVPAYTRSGGVTPAELRRSVQETLQLVLELLTEGREPTAAELRRQAALGARRAEAGVDASEVSRAFRIGFLVVWDGLTAHATAAGPAVVETLLSNAARVWWLQHRMCAVVEGAHRERVLQLQASTDDRGRALLAALAGLPDTADEADRLARALGLPPAGPFVAALVSGEHGRRPPTSGGLVVERDGQVVVLSCVRSGAVGAPERLAAELAPLGWAHVGVGLCLPGLDGARRSLHHAERAHRAAQLLGAPLLSASRDWYSCLVGAAAEDLGEVLADAVAGLARDSELAATVAAYLRACGNLTEAAGALYLHPNTVAYRVRRLGETTGLDLRSPDGLLRGHAALALLGRPVCS